MNLKLIKKLCSYEESDLEKVLIKYLQANKYPYNYKKNNYIIASGELPICLIAHMDTVFPYFINEFYYDKEKKVLWNPYGAGFDCRAGVYAIIQIIEAGYRPSIIFTNGEEMGGIGACSLINDYPQCPILKCKSLIELDRMGKDDSVYYNCNNHKFKKYINKFGFKTNYGTFSDISILSPFWGIASVNLSIGYEDEHSKTERLHCDWCDRTIEKVKIILNNSTEMPFYSYSLSEKNNYCGKQLNKYYYDL